MIDYGDIVLRLKPGMSFDQKVQMLRMTLNNQLFSNEFGMDAVIFDKCKTLIRLMGEESSEFTYTTFLYMFKITIQYLENSVSCI